MAAGAPKLRTLYSKWQLEHPKFEPFAQSGSWSAQSPNPAGTQEPEHFPHNSIQPPPPLPEPKGVTPGVIPVTPVCSKWQLERKSLKELRRAFSININLIGTNIGIDININTLTLD